MDAADLRIFEAVALVETIFIRHTYRGATQAEAAE